MKKWKLTLFVAVLLFTVLVLEKRQILSSDVTDYVLSNDDLLLLTNWTKDVFSEEEKVTVTAPVVDSHINEYNSMQSFSNGVLLSYGKPLTIYAKYEGFVIFTGHTKSLGKTMTITYETGERVTYGLLNSLDYLPYTTIREGEPIATMDSGTFYLQVERQGAMLDPASLKDWLR